jgi:hypothetical protein
MADFKISLAYPRQIFHSKSLNLLIFRLSLKLPTFTDDNSYMKSIIKNILTAFILSTSLLLVGCMPDSLTKFKEDAPKKKEADGGIIIAPPPETCTPGATDGGFCTPLSGVTYPGITANELNIAIGTANFGKPITTLTPNLFPAGNNAIDYTIFSISPALPSGLSFNANTGAISGTPAAAIARTLYTVTATHTNYSTAPVTTHFYLSVGTNLGEVIYKQPGYTGGANNPTRLIISLGETSTSLGTPNQPTFTVTTGNVPNLSSNNGARGMIRFINYPANELFVEVHETLSEGNFREGDLIDSNSSYFSQKGRVDGVTIGFPRLSTMIASLPVTTGGRRLLAPTVSPQAGLSFFTNESSLFTYSLTPNLPSTSGISFNSTTGEIFWNTITPTQDLDRSYYTLTVRNTLGQTREHRVRLSIKDVAAPKSLTELYFPQTVGSKIILSVANVELFKPASQLTGRITLTSGSTNVTGSATNFTSELTVGSRFSVNNTIYQVATVNSPTSLTLTAPAVESTGSIIAVPLNSTISGFYDGGTPLDTRDDINVRGLIDFIDDATKELYVTITDYPASGLLAMPQRGFFPGMKLYNGTYYQSQVAIVGDVVSSFNINSAPGILARPFILPFHQNGLLVSPANDEDIQQVADLNLISTPSLDSIIGNLNLITNEPTVAAPNDLGAINAIGPLAEESTKTISYTLTNAFNRVFTRNLKFKLVQAPSEIALTKQAIFALRKIDYSLAYVQSNFQIGAIISSPSTPPSTVVKKARVKQIFEGADEVYIYVDLLNGEFQLGDSLDNWRVYATERAQIQRVVNVSHKLRLNTNAAPALQLGDSISFTSGATARIVLIDNADIFVLLTNDQEITTGDSVSVGGSIVRTVNTIFTNQLKFNVSSPASFLVGRNIVKANGAEGRGIINRITGSEVGVNVDYGYFDNGFAITNSNSDRAAYQVGTISSQPTTENLFTLYRGQETTIKINMTTAADSARLSIHPALPPGLTLDSEKMSITGTPTDSRARTAYTITAFNGAGETSFKFYLRVNSAFEIVEQTASRSPILHQSGRNNHTRSCLVTDDMLTANNNVIDCHLDVGELDIAFHGLTFAPNTSAGICSYVRYNPYYYNKLEPKTTTNSVVYRVNVGNFANCTGSDPTAMPEYPYGRPKCLGNYENHGVNCDEGSYILETYTYDNSCVRTFRSQIVNCNGNRTQCLDGPVTEQLQANQIRAGIRHVLVNAESGLDSQTTNNASKFRVASMTAINSTIKGANFTYRNSCTNPTDPWEYRTYDWYFLNANVAGYADPFKQANPYYTFDCLDTAQGIKAQINIKVRDWDMDFVGLPPFDTGIGYDMTHIVPNNYMSVAGEDNRYDWDSSNAFRRPYPSTVSYPNAFCEPNIGYKDPSISSLVYNGTITLAPTSNYMELSSNITVTKGDLLVIPDASGYAHSYFTVEESSTGDTIYVSRPYRDESFTSGIGSFDIYLVPEANRIRFPVEAGIIPNNN